MSAENPVYLEGPKCGDCRNFKPDQLNRFFGTCTFYARNHGGVIIRPTNTPLTHQAYFNERRNAGFKDGVAAMLHRSRISCFKAK